MSSAHLYGGNVMDGGCKIGSLCHARTVENHESLPRVLLRCGELALDRGAISIESAVRSSTSLPAQILGLQDRGLIRAGLAFAAAMLILGVAKAVVEL